MFCVNKSGSSNSFYNINQFKSPLVGPTEDEIRKANNQAAFFEEEERKKKLGNQGILLPDAEVRPDVIICCSGQLDART